MSLAAAFPSILRHAGVWEGVYRHYDAQDRLLDRHATRIICEFPADGPYAYVQHNRFRWEDGRESHGSYPATLRDGRLWWDVPTFAGCAWEGGHGLILLDLERRDLPGARMLEMIALAPDGATRTRTWHWLHDGAFIRRTLCDERRAG